jgi:hypothetical protein
MSTGVASRPATSATLVVATTTAALMLALSPGSRLGLWAGTSVAGAVGLGAAMWHALPGLAELLRPTLRSAGLGVLGGAVMALLTHLLYPLAVAMIPDVADQALVLYHRLDSPPGRVAAIPIVLLVVMAEELVWRGIAYAQLRRHLGRPAAVAVATLIYAVPQLASGTWLLPALALTCGAVWTTQRAVSGNLVVPLLTHFTWNLLVMVAFPLTV